MAGLGQAAEETQKMTWERQGDSFVFTRDLLIFRVSGEEVLAGRIAASEEVVFIIKVVDVVIVAFTVGRPFVKFGFETGERVRDTKFGGVDRVEVDEAYLASIPTLVRPCWIHATEVEGDISVFVHEYGEEESSSLSSADFLSVSFKVVVILLSRREVNGSEIVTTMPTDDDTSIVKVK